MHYFPGKIKQNIFNKKKYRNLPKIKQPNEKLLASLGKLKKIIYLKYQKY
jgi:hypothetical protein